MYSQPSRLSNSTLTLFCYIHSHHPHTQLLLHTTLTAMKRGLSTGDITATGLTDENDSSLTKTRNGRKKSRKAVASSQPVQNTSSTADIGADIAGNNEVSATVQSEIAELRKSVEQLSIVVNDQKATINNLYNKLKFVLSFLDINDCGPDSVSFDTATATNVVVSTLQQTDVVAGGSSTSDADANVTTQQSNQLTSRNVTYASAAAVNRESSGSGPPRKLRHAVAAVVYADQRAKEKRAKTVVVSGLAPSQADDDALIFQRLCMLDIGIDPTITYTRRLGAAGRDRVRPLLVGFQSVNDVSLILSQAKKLRTSANEVTRNNVYINRNLTKLEEQLAYEERCRRRNRLLATGRTETMSVQRSENSLSSLSQSPTTAVTTAATTTSSTGRPP